MRAAVSRDYLFGIYGGAIMNEAKPIKVRELISRATYKTVKNMNREDMNDWAKALYNDAMRDCEAASMLALKDEFGFSTKRLARFMSRRNNTTDCINRREISAQEIILGLIDEGVDIVESDGSVPGKG